MTSKNAEKPGLTEQPAGRDYRISEQLLQLAITTLVELPYKEVATLVNSLRVCKPLESDDA